MYVAFAEEVSEVKLLITGIKGYICENCAKQAYDIVLSSGVLNDKKNDKFALKQVPKPVEIKQYLDQYIIGQDGAKRSLPWRCTITISVCSRLWTTEVWK